MQLAHPSSVPVAATQASGALPIAHAIAEGVGAISPRKSLFRSSGERESPCVSLIATAVPTSGHPGVQAPKMVSENI